MGAGQFLLPHLGAQPRILLDRFVASGAAGIDEQDTDDWVLWRLVQLGYVEERTPDNTTFVCTPAGRHRWQIEIVADEVRCISALRRQLNRRRLDERFIRLGIDTSMALTTAYSSPEPRLHRRVQAPWNPPPRTRGRLSSPLTTMFAAAAAALVVISADSDPQEVWTWLFAPKPHAAAVLAEHLKAKAGQAALIGSRAAVVPVDLNTEDVSGHAVSPTDVAQVGAQRFASVDTIASNQKKEVDKITYQAERGVSVRNRTLPTIEPATRERAAVVDAASPDGGAILNSVVTAASLIDVMVSGSGHIVIHLTTSIESGLRSTAAELIDAAMSDSGQFATDVTAGVEHRIKPIAGALLEAAADIGNTIEWSAATQPVPNDAPASVSPATELPVEGEQQAAIQSAFASHTKTESVRAAIVYASPNGRVTTTSPAARGDEAKVDSQHEMVERLNRLSLAAARRGEAWQPMLEETGRLP